MVFAEENQYFFFVVSGQNLADFGQGFAGNDHFCMFIVILQGNIADGNTMSVQGNDL